VRPREGSAAEDFEYSCQLKHLTSLIADCTGHEIALRVYPLPKTEHTPRPGAGLYTIDEFVLDARARVVSIGPDKAETVTGGPETFACRVIRFVPSVV
jgi:hypothetical protein